MPYVWYIVCKTPIPVPPRPISASRPGVVRVNLKTGKSTPVPASQRGLMILPLAASPYSFLYRRDCHNSWEWDVRLADAYRLKEDAEADALLLVTKGPHLIGHVRVMRVKRFCYEK